MSQQFSTETQGFGFSSFWFHRLANLVASLLLVVLPGAPSSFLLLVAMSFVTGSFLVSRQIVLLTMFELVWLCGFLEDPSAWALWMMT